MSEDNRTDRPWGSFFVLEDGVRTKVKRDTRDMRYGDHVFVKRGTKHRIACTGSEPVEIIEVQTGDSFAEEDIVRYSDDYGRDA
jgi:mannose-6-phosphate isomerase-like protein (cupin superfamily)